MTFLGLPRRVALTYAALFAAACVVYGSLWRRAPVVEGDSPQYLAVAADLADGRLDTLHDRTIGYPVLLALTGSTHAPTRLLLYASLLLHFVSVWCLGALLHASGAGVRWMLLLAALLWLPMYVEPAGMVMTEILGQAAVVTGLAGVLLWIWGGPRVLLGLGVLGLTWAALTRPAFQALPLAFAVTLLAFGSTGRLVRLRRAAVTAGVLVVGTGLLLASYAVFNAQRFGFFGVAFSTGFHLTTKTMYLFERLPDEHAVVREILIAERDVQLTERGGTHTGTQTIWSVREALEEATGLSRPELSRHLLALNLLLIRRAPLEYLQEVARAGAVYWFPTFSPLATFDAGALRWAWAATHAALVLLFALQLTAIAGWLLLRRAVLPRHRQPALPRRLANPRQGLAYVLGVLVVFYTMALTCAIDIGEPRQRRATDAVFVFVCVLGLDAWRRVRAGELREDA